MAVIAVCCLCNAADGFDVASLSVAAPVLSREWNLDPAMLGLVFTSASIGLALGAFTIGPLTERIGRRPVMLTAIGSLTINLFLTAICNTVMVMAGLRFLTGLALGALVVCLNAHVAEYAGEKSRNMALAVLHVGFTIGLMAASTVAAIVLETLGWREVFMAASLLNAVTFVLCLVLIEESPAFLAGRRRTSDLARYNRAMRRLSQPEVAELPHLEAGSGGKRLRFTSLLAPPYRTQTILLWVAALTYSIVGYFQMQWKPTIIANAGISPSIAAASGLVAGLFGAVGHLAMGGFGQRFGERRLTGIFFSLTVVALVLFAIQPPQLVPLMTTAGLISFFLVGAYTGLFLVAVITYPTELKTSGLGAMVGFTRVGSAIGPMLGGLLLSYGFSRMNVYFIFSAIAVVPAIAVFTAMAKAGTPKPVPAAA